MEEILEPSGPLGIKVDGIPNMLESSPLDIITTNLRWASTGEGLRAGEGGRGEGGKIDPLCHW